MLFDQGFKVGDRVYYIRRGVWGTISSINEREIYPVRVETDNDSYEYFKLDGREYELDVIPGIVFEEFTYEAPKRKFTPALIGKTLVITTKDDVVIGKVTHETVNQLTIDQHPTIRKSVIKTIHDLGEEIKL